MATMPVARTRRIRTKACVLPFVGVCILREGIPDINSICHHFPSLEGQGKAKSTNSRLHAAIHRITNSLRFCVNKHSVPILSIWPMATVRPMRTLMRRLFIAN